MLLAVAVPSIGPFIALLGAFCFSILGLLVPVFIETVTYWDIGFGKGNWVAMKNVVITIIGVLALLFGSRSSLIDIVKELYGKDGNIPLLNATMASVLNATTESSLLTTIGN